MRWQGDQPRTTATDHHLAIVRGQTQAHDWAVHHDESDRCPISFTVGLHDRGSPELLVTGLAPADAQWLLNTFAKRVATGRRPVSGDRVSLPADTLIEIVDVEQPEAYVGRAVAVAGCDITAIQLVWADGRGRWPWAPGFDDGHRSQPVLGLRTLHA